MNKIKLNVRSELKLVTKLSTQCMFITGIKEKMVPGCKVRWMIRREAGARLNMYCVKIRYSSATGDDSCPVYKLIIIIYYHRRSLQGIWGLSPI